MKKFYTLFILLFLLGSFGYAQSAAILKGQVTDEKGNALESVTVSALKATDRKLAKITTTDKQGRFELNSLVEGEYLLQLSSRGFESYTSEVQSVKSGIEMTLPAISLKPSSEDLKAVTVTARKPMVEVKADKTVVNVDAFISNAGGTALEVLEKSPGISVDRDGNISLKGKQGVIVLIDGKPTYLGGQDLANFLRNTPSSQLESVEIMTQPSAKYDASGNSGIINIRTKKGRQNGFNGSVNLGYIQGVYPKTSNSINLNYKKDKLNLFSTASYSYWQGFNHLDLLRKFKVKDSEDLAAVFDQQTNAVYRNNNTSLRLGADYQFDKNTSLGVQVNGTYNPRQFNSRSRSDIFNGNGQLDSSNRAASSNSDEWKNFGTNINFRKRLDTTGRELTADLDFIWYGSQSNQTSDNYTYHHPGNTLADSFLLKGKLPSDIKIYSAKADYVHPLGKGARMEAGIKSSLVKTDNDARYTLWNAGSKDWVTDMGRSNHFLYEENINAAYINYNREFKKWSLQTGLRFEHTYARGKQLSNNEQFKRDYAQLFPTVFASYKLNDKNQMNASYGRRIERPNYRDMNPFQYFLDQYTYQAGNPYLQPQFSHNFELSHNFKGVLNTTLNYTLTTDIINDILKQNEETKVTFQTKENIARRKNIGLAISYNKPLTKWWTISMFGNIFRNQFEGRVNELPLDAGYTSFMANMNNQFKIAKTWGGELSGFYRSKSQEAGILIAKPMGMISLGLSKQVLKSKGTLKLSVTDPFRTMRFWGETVFGPIDTNIQGRWDNRRVTMNFSYRFGKLQNGGPQRRRSGSASDEQNRVGASNQQ